MKKGLSFVLALLLLCTALPLAAMAEAPAPSADASAQAAADAAPLTPVEQLVDADGNVVFNDTTMEQSIRNCLGVLEGPISKKQLAAMGSKYEILYITASSPVTVDLSLLQLCSKLKLLAVDGVTPANWSAVSTLKGLTNFMAYNQTFSDLRFLAGMKNLLNIALYDSTCADISAVTEIPKLYNFHAETPLADITPLYACKKLKGLTLTGLTDEQINGLLDSLGKKLTDVGLKDCAPAEATMQRILSLKLQSLLLDNVKTGSVAQVFGIKTLRWGLTLANMEVPSLEGIQNLKKMQYVKLDNVTGLTDYTPLYKLAGVTSLSISNCPAPDLTGIEGMKKLNYLSLDTLTGTLALTPVFGLGKLQTLSIYSVTADTLAGIEKLTKLTGLYMYNLQGITDFSPLSGLKKIQSISTDMQDQMPEGLPVY